MIYLELLALAFAVAFIIDLSGVTDTIKKVYFYSVLNMHIMNIKPKKIIEHLYSIMPDDYRNLKLKPFDCSLCMTFWVLSLYTLITGCLSVYTFCYITILAYFSSLTSLILVTIKDFVGKCLDRLYDILILK